MALSVVNESTFKVRQIGEACFFVILFIQCIAKTHGMFLFLLHMQSM